ncbi:MAG TPA: glycine--tRNA ligase subunit beta [Gammaproteobacteria bacterium]|nr:glycine--tRNA ligase subunit beta [Gammaproteobacteria bacterium]
MRQLPLKQADFLIEIQTEELPPKALSSLGSYFLDEIKTRLQKAELQYRDAVFFATPRRLAVLVKKLNEKQPDHTIERKGPARSAAYDKDGKPTPACLGFAKSCGVTADELAIIKTPEGEWVSYKQSVAGKTVQAILPGLVEQALASLPIQKRMRWGAGSAQFVRPVKSVLMLYGEAIIDAEILGCQTGRQTRGHRFHSKGFLSIAKPANYVTTLKRHHVIVDFNQRKEWIRAAATESLKNHPDLHVVMDDHLLDEVTGLVEWPVALYGQFDETFLQVPPDAIIAAMQDHQRYFPVMNAKNQLMPFFVTISNIESKNSEGVIEGNERVLRARLSDAAFFFETDKKRRLIDRVDDLKKSIFQAKLGTLFEKSERIQYLAGLIAETIQADPKKAKRAGLLAKADLTTQMVGEFPELQGVMGFYYATHDQENKEVAEAIREQYMPRFSGDALPETPLGCVVALADRIDTLVSIFGINQMPTGDKDPFALRRAALGVLRILIEKKLNLDLKKLIQSAADNLRDKLENRDVVSAVRDFIFDRLNPWYQDQGISPDVFASVAALPISSLYDFHLRILAVQYFKQLPEAESLSIANKRVANILAKTNGAIEARHLDEKLFEHDAERALAARLAEKSGRISVLSDQGDYQTVLTELAGLRETVDHFFEHVMVMTEDKPRRENRLLLLKQLRELFLRAADIALLQ